MRSILKQIIFAFVCCLFLMQAAVTAQESQREKENKTDKTDKTKKTVLAPLTLDDLAIQLPDVEGWQKSDIQKYPTEDLGFSVNYDSRMGGRVTIYVYSGGRKSIPNDITDTIIKGELEKAKSEIHRAAEMGYYQNVREVKNDTVTLGGSSGKVKALRSLFDMSAGGRDLASEIYLFAHQNRFIKIRASRQRSQTVNEALIGLLAEFDEFFSK